MLLPLLGMTQSIAQDKKLEDYQMLIKLIKENYPFYDLKEQLTGIDFDIYFTNKENYLKNNLISDEEFVFIVNSTLTYLQDQHTRIVSYENVIYYEYPIASAFANYNKDSINYRHKQFYKYIYSKIVKDYYQGLKCNYLDGNYYTNLPIKYRNKVYDYGMQIVAVNGTPIDSVVYNNLDNIYCNWDFKHQKYFSENFSHAQTVFFNKDSVCYTLINHLKDTLKLEFQFGEKDLIDYKKSKWIQTITNHVRYFKKENILYIRLIAMDFYNRKDKLLNKIQKQKGKRIDKVVIDIRNNGGGNDLVWLSFVSSIIDTSFVCDINIASLNYEKSKLFYSDVSREQSKIPFSHRAFYKLDMQADIQNYFQANDSTINYNGKIYIIQDRDIFSSAVSLSSLCKYNNRFVSVGQANGKTGGFGEEPMLFVLPNSQIMFTIDATIDYTQIKSIDDYYNSVEVPLEYNIDDYFHRASTNFSIYSKSFLRKKDPFFKKIIMFKD